MNIVQQINARKRLMLSAKLAYNQGISRESWETAQEIQEFVSNLGLAHDIPKHIATWVWTFKR